MNHLYIDSRLHVVRIPRTFKPRTWRFVLGVPHLLLTPTRLELLVARLGIGDTRILAILRMVRRHAVHPARYCRPLGLPVPYNNDSTDYPPALCPRCDDVHQPHPEDAGIPCHDCLDREEQERRRAPTPGVRRDWELDYLARHSLLETDPRDFRDGVLSPNWQYNDGRRLQRDWDAAINRILMGMTYRQVAKEFDCSVGILHRKVHAERHWENN